jgi:hypothetical protein
MAAGVVSIRAAVLSTMGEVAMVVAAVTTPMLVAGVITAMEVAVVVDTVTMALLGVDMVPVAATMDTLVAALFSGDATKAQGVETLGMELTGDIKIIASLVLEET